MKLVYSLITGLLMSTALFSNAANAACSDNLNFSFRPLASKEPVKLCDKYQGQVLLVVNTASKCGFTKQYEGLENLHANLSAKGFAVLGFPSNQFGGQEPGTEQEIQEFCTLTYGVKFPMFEKTEVKGDNASAFYKLLAKDGGGEPKWNFHKYLIGRDGKIIKGYSSSTTPSDATLMKDIETALLAKAK